MGPTWLSCFALCVAVQRGTHSQKKIVVETRIEELSPLYVSEVQELLPQKVSSAGGLALVSMY